MLVWTDSAFLWATASTKAKVKPVELALELLKTFRASRFGARVVVLADSGFSSRDFITGCKDLGFTRLLLGMKCDRRSLHEVTGA